MMPNYYFDEHEEAMHTKQYWLDHMRENGIDSMEVRKAQIEYGACYFWCSEYQATLLKEDNNCGKFCDSYQPRNGKSGRCKFSKNCYEAVGEPIVLTV